MHNQFYAVKLFFISLLLSMGIVNAVNGQARADLYVNRNTVAGNGNNFGDIIAYDVQFYNDGDADITESKMTANIPSGTTYIPGSTKLNGVAVPDVNGKMPFSGSGASVNSVGAEPGVVIISDYTYVNEIEYSVKITASVGTLKTSVAFQGNSVSGPATASVTDQLVLQNSCNSVYQSTGLIASGAPPTYPYKIIKTLNTTNGTAGSTIYTGNTGPCFDALTGASLATGSVLTDAEAMALDPVSNRIYFINGTTNNPAQDLCYIDLNTSPVSAKRFVNIPLETNTAAGFNIDRMTWSSDGNGYALTANAQDLIRFSIDPSTGAPVITHLGPLVNAPTNGTNDVLASSGGDMIADGSGNLYLFVTTNRMLYKIVPATRVASAMGIIRGVSSTDNNALAVDGQGNILIGGAYQSVYKLDLGATGNTPINSGTTNVWKTGDYASCTFPILAPGLTAVKTYSNSSGTSPGTVSAGEQIEYSITVSNPGNMTATNVKLYDAIPPGSHYIPNSTFIDGNAVADIGGLMPYSVSGGQYISTRFETAQGIIKPGDINKVVIKFRVAADQYTTICNQAQLSYSDETGNTVSILSEKNPGMQNSTCFYSDKGPLQATKTWRCPFTNATQVVAGDPVEYTIVVTNTGSTNASIVALYDAIPANSHYMTGTAKLNGTSVADIGGVMPFAVSGGQSINSPGQPAGVVAPGDANKATVTFMVTTDKNVTVCNQASAYLNGVNFLSDDPAQSGTQDATCFFSNGDILGTRKAVNGTTNTQSDLQPVISSAQVMPNPFVQDLNLQVQLTTAENVLVRLTDFYGRTVFTTTQKLAAGMNALHLNVPSSLSAGIYVLELSAGNKRLLQQKLIKQ